MCIVDEMRILLGWLGQVVFKIAKENEDNISRQEQPLNLRCSPNKRERHSSIR